MFGFVEVNGRVVGSKARYKCQKGYHLIGSEERVCQADGSWSRTPPECRENLYCTDPPVIAHAKHDSPAAQTRYEVNHTLQYSCNEGYITEGFSAAKCFLYNGTMQWFGPKIKCSPKSCGDPGDLMNGFKEGSCHEYSCRVTYHCRPGFELVGRSDYYCQQDGTWNPRELPLCKAVQCETPENPNNGKVVYTTKSYNSVVTYECSYGYMIVGSATRRCGPNKKWSDEKPECREINCGTPGILYNGWIEGSKTTMYAVVHFSCFDGMTFEGRSIRAVCSSNGTWSEPLPHCYEINCGSPGHLSNGWVENLEKGTSLGASIVFRCFPNMTLEGDDTSVCQSTGKWNTPLPKCLAPCIVPTIKNGKVNNTQTGEKVSHAFQLNVTCDSTFELAFGNTLPTCFNGTWSRYPHCNPARCKTLPPRPRHGIVIVPKSEHGTKARFRCKDGYRLVGSQTTECQFGNWTGGPPLCQEVYCPFPGTVENGRVLLVGNMGMYDYRDYVQKVKNNRLIRYKCNRGFYLVNGPPGATCVAGRWSPDKLPQCRPDLHPRMKWVRKRSVNFSELLNSEESDYITDPPIFLDDVSTPPPKSVEEAPPATANREKGYGQPHWDGFIRRTSFFPIYSNVLRTGNSLDSSEEDVVRRLTGKQEEELHEKVADPGRREEEVPSLAMIESNERAEKRQKPLSKKGVIGVGDSKRIKRNVLAHEGVSVSPRIEYDTLDKKERKRLRLERREKRMMKRRLKGRRIFAHCDEIKEEAYMRVEIIRPGRDDNYTFSSGARLKVTCLHGYGLNIGNKTAKCARGRWKPLRPECYNLPCNVPATDHGEFEYNGQRIFEDYRINHGEVVKFSCLAGYNVIGTDTMRCWYGEWAVTGKNPECHPMSCVLPDILNGRYDSGNKQNLTIMSGAMVEYNCDPGWRKDISEIKCVSGKLRPSNPQCIAIQVKNGTSGVNVKRSEPLTASKLKAKKSAEGLHKQTDEAIDETSQDHQDKTSEEGVERKYQVSELSAGKDITGLTITTVEKKSCALPPIIPNTKVFKSDGNPLGANETIFSELTNLTLVCMRLFLELPQDNEWFRWQIQCEDGSWINIVPPFSCDDGIYSNETCIWEPYDQTVVSFYNDQELTNDRVELPPRAKLYSRCIDIGKFRLSGTIMRRCKNGTWTGEEPSCEGLSQEHNYALDKPPTILIRHMSGPIAQSNDGKLVVYPGTVLHLECLWVRRFGTPRWNVSQTITEIDPKKKKKRKKKVKAGKRKGAGGIRVDRKYPEGWTTDPRRNRQLEYRLSLYKAKKDDSGTYICTTPAKTEHMVVVDVKAIHCPEITKATGLHINPDSTQMSTKVNFNCDPGSMLVGAQTIICKPSGNWSAPQPHCEKVRCITPLAPKNGRVEGDGPFHAGDMVQISCQPNFMMDGHPMIVCQQDGQWSGDVPKCLEACTYPGTIISGTMSSVKFYYGVGDAITYTCSEGFVLHGSRHIQCLKGAKWSGPVPSCLPQS